MSRVYPLAATRISMAMGSMEEVRSTCCRTLDSMMGAGAGGGAFLARARAGALVTTSIESPTHTTLPARSTTRTSIGLSSSLPPAVAAAAASDAYTTLR